MKSLARYHSLFLAQQLLVDLEFLFADLFKAYKQARANTCAMITIGTKFTF
jgi:hypothetical protein